MSEIYRLRKTDAGETTITANIKKSTKTTSNSSLDNNILRKSDYPVMKTLPGGTFKMGPDRWDDPVYEVTISSFKIAATEVTQTQFQKIMGYNPSEFKGDDLRPVENVSWFEANEYNLRLSMKTATLNTKQKEKLNECLKKIESLQSSIPYNKRTETNKYQEELLKLAAYREVLTDYCSYVFTKEGIGLYRLPTEAEWEYAAKGGKQYQYGTVDGTLSNENTVLGTKMTEPVASKKPNPFGLYDVAGNVSEFCADRFGMDFYQNNSAKDPVNLNKGDRVVMRGGSWTTPYAEPQRTGRRGVGIELDDHSNACGFRPAIGLK